MEKPLLITEPMITALTLAKQWVGMPRHKFVEHLEEIENRSEPDFTQPDGVADFPQPFWTEGTRENPVTRERITVCLPWQTEERDSDSMIRKYWRRCISQGSDSLSKLFDEVVFKCEDVKRYEDNHPEVLHELIDPDVAWGRCHHRRPELTLVSELEAHIAETEEKLKKSRRIRKKLKEQIARMEEEGPSTVNAALWENSVKDALSLLVEILQGDKTDWIRGEFKKRLKGHTKVVEAAWSAIPDTFKQGQGRPPKP